MEPWSEKILREIGENLYKINVIDVSFKSSFYWMMVNLLVKVDNSSPFGLNE
jgi:hypothetical protein